MKSGKGPWELTYYDDEDMGKRPNSIGYWGDKKTPSGEVLHVRGGLLNNWHEVIDYDDCGEWRDGSNARLIAAAPEMLSILDSVVMAFELPGDHCEMEQAVKMARDIIAKIGKE